MGAWESDGRHFDVLMVSDVVHDGMSLELTDLDHARAAGPALEIFYSDRDATTTFSALRPINVPIEVLTRFVEAARATLPPSR